MANAVTFDLFARDRASGAFVKVGQAASKAGKEIEGMGRKSSGLSNKFTLISRIGPRSFGALATGAKAAGLALGGAAISAGIFGLKTASNMEQARISFSTMLGSAQKADKFLRQLQKFAATTPFEFPELQTAASSLISAGFEAKRIIPIMRTLGDVTSGMGTGSEGVRRATIALQQMSAAGRITGEDLNQLRDAGVPVFDLLAKATGKSKAEVVKLAAAGKLGKKEMDQLFKALETGKGLERFNGLMEKQSKSLAGLFSTLKDNVSMSLANLIAPAIPAIKAGLTWMTTATAEVGPKIQAGLGVVVPWIRGTLVPDAVAAFKVLRAKLEAALPKIDLSGLARSFTEQAKGWGTALIAGVKAGLATGDWSGLGDTVGRGLLAAISGAAGLAGKIGSKIGELFGNINWFDVGKSVGKTAFPFIIGFSTTLVDGLFKAAREHPFDTVLFFASFLGIGKIGGVISKLLSRIPFLRAFAPLFEGLNKLTKPLNDAIGRILGSIGRAFLRGLGIESPRMGRALVRAFDGLRLRIWYFADGFGKAGLGLVERAGRGVRAGLGFLGRTFADVAGFIGRFLARLLGPVAQPFLRAGSNLLGRMSAGIRSAYGAVNAAISGTITRLTAPFRVAGRWLLGVGGDLVHGLFAGIRGAMRGVGSVLGSVKDAIVGGLKRLFHIGSPSKVMAELGGHMITGLIKGLLTQSGALAQTVKSIGGNIAGIFGGIDLGFGQGSTSAGAMQSMVAGYAQMLYGWTGAQWAALNKLLTRESGFNPNAQNPTSTAYGLFQFLDSTWSAVNARKTSNPQMQTLAGLRYIAGRYGTPADAWNHEMMFGWYGKGLPPTVFSRPTLIGVGERGPETVTVVPRGARSAGGGDVYYITVNALSPQQAAVAVEQALVARKRQRGGGKLAFESR